MSQGTKAVQSAKKELPDNAEEAEGLLSSSPVSEDGDLVIFPRVNSKTPGHRPSPLLPQPQRQSSLAQPRPDGAPRTPNRVQFDDAPMVRTMSPRHSLQSNSWIEDEDYLGGHRRGARVPLLTGIEAPSVTLASDDFNPEDLLEGARPKSGMKSAFMNMANSIM